MLEMKQISILSNLDLAGSARHGIKIAPSEIAERLGLEVEKVFDDFGYFEFLGISLPSCRLGFRRYTAKDDIYSYVTCTLGDKDEAAKLISDFCEINVDQVYAFDDDW